MLAKKLAANESGQNIEPFHDNKTRKDAPTYRQGSNVDTLLSQLDKVTPLGPNRWKACCPAHNDRGPSLAIRELDDGRILLHCFAGCSTQDVLAARNLSFDDLFPEQHVKRVHLLNSERRPFPATDVLRCLSHETLVVLIAAEEMARGNVLSSVDSVRLTLAVGHIQQSLYESGVANA